MDALPAALRGLLPAQVLQATKTLQDPVAFLVPAGLAAFAVLGCCLCLLLFRCLLRAKGEHLVAASSSIEMGTGNLRSAHAVELEQPGFGSFHQVHQGSARAADDYRVKSDSIVRFPSAWGTWPAKEKNVDAQPSTGWGRYSLTRKLQSDRSQISNASQPRSILKGVAGRSSGFSQGTEKSVDSRVCFPEEHKLAETIAYTPEHSFVDQEDLAVDPDGDDDADDWEAFQARMRAWSKGVLGAEAVIISEAADVAGTSKEQDVDEGVG